MSLPKVAYFCMEMAIDQSLHTYSGGLGFLAGSHMRSAGHLKLPMLGVSILWKYGYGEQRVNENGEIEIYYVPREYNFLKDTGITVEVNIFGRPVKVRALLLEPDIFDTAPVYFLTTDIPENTEEDRKLTDKLYDAEQRTRISQEIILGVAGMRVLKAAHERIDLVHMNEGHALPAAFELLDDFGGDLEKVRNSLVFTTHTPVAAGNETHDARLLAEAGFFCKTSLEEAIRLGGEDFSLTVAALRLSRLANGVSQLHGLVANNMWQWVDNRCPIIAITNATNLDYWQDPRMHNAIHCNTELLKLKKDMKKELLHYVEQNTGKRLDPDVLTITWARRFTEYKRSTLIFKDIERISKLLNGQKIQLLFAGKFHPSDNTGRRQFNEILEYARQFDNVAVLSNPGYELELSGILKRGSDVWLNTPVRPLEASGTSGMSANMNGTIHFSIYDGWAVEGTFDQINGYLINHSAHSVEYLNVEDRHKQDYESMMQILEADIIPTYYENPERWAELMRQAIYTSQAYFNSDRMVVEYYVRLYKSVYI